jgi:transcriptional regulator with XRE-family HTH domain
MDKDQAEALGRVLRSKREELGWSTPEAARRSHIQQSTVVRLELGAFQRPSADNIVRLATALGLNLADVYQLAGLPLPSLPAYLRSKYRDLPALARAELEDYLVQLSTKYGLDVDGPAPGEDEDTD